VAEKTDETKLQIRRTFRGTRERIFRAWTEAKELEQWMCRDAGHTTKYLESDVRPGGRFRLEGRTPTGDVYWLWGTYKEVKPPERLVFTWAWEMASKREDSMGETMVTVEFLSKGESTEVVLTHEFFKNAALRDGTTKGWEECLDILGRSLGMA
jgi:uncharacterized protein YndB with AHSA1/START domain